MASLFFFYEGMGVDVLLQERGEFDLGFWFSGICMAMFFSWLVAPRCTLALYSSLGMFLTISLSFTLLIILFFLFAEGRNIIMLVPHLRILHVETAVPFMGGDVVDLPVA